MDEKIQSEAQVNKKKILLIDDEEDFCFFVKMNLEKSGNFEVLTTTSGSNGIFIAVKEQPDLILLDIIMPDISGGQVAEQLLDNPKTKEIPLLFITAIASRRDVQAKEEPIGGRQFIAKPVTPEELMDKLYRVFEINR